MAESSKCSELVAQACLGNRNSMGELAVYSWYVVTKDKLPKARQLTRTGKLRKGAQLEEQLIGSFEDRAYVDYIVNLHNASLAK